MSVNINKKIENYVESEMPTQNKYTRFCNAFLSLNLGPFEYLAVNMGKSTN